MRKHSLGAMMATFAAGLPGVAMAHTLDGDASPVEQLVHHTLATHHLATTMLVIVAGVLLLRLWLRPPKSSSNTGRQ